MKKNIDLSEISRCHVCTFPRCTEACPNGINVGNILRSLVLNNIEGAARTLAKSCRGTFACLSCPAPCEKACLMGASSHPVSIRKIFSSIEPVETERQTEPDISCDICGVKLENPFLLSSSVVASTYDMCARAFDAGWAGASFKTICSFPQHETSPRFSALKTNSNSFAGFKNIEQLSDHSVRENMEIFYRLRINYPSKVIVASIMGQSEEEWTRLARYCTMSGASVIECNFSCPNMESDSLGITIGQSAELIERFTAAVRRGTSLPILAKLTPNITDMVPMALAAKRGGADGIAAINTINSITGVDIDSFVAEPVVHGKSIIGGYSGRAVKPIALRFIADIARCEELKGLHISGMGGITTWKDALDFLLLGAQSLQVTTAVMEYGYRIIDDLTDGLKNYLASHNLPSLRQIIGAATKTIVDHTEIERDTILLPKFNYDICRGCGRCYTSCMDGGHQAISFDSVTRKPVLNAKKCVGCHLCKIVCPFNAIGTAAKSFAVEKPKDEKYISVFTKIFGDLYSAGKEPKIVFVPRANYITIKNTNAAFHDDQMISKIINTMLSLSSTLKMCNELGHPISGYQNYELPPAERLIWYGDAKDRFYSLNRLPDFVTKEDFDWAVDRVSKEKPGECLPAELMELDEGLCVQVLHLGPLEKIPETLAKIDVFLKENDYERNFTDGSFLHSIHLSNMTQLDNGEKMIIIRQPVRKKS